MWVSRADVILLACYMLWWDSKPGRWCQLHHSQTLYNRDLGWICLNYFYKVNFLRQKGVSTLESQTVLSNLQWLSPEERKVKAVQSMVLLFLQGESSSLLSSLISTNSQISWAVTTSAQTPGIQDGFGHQSWGLGLQNFTVFSPLPSTLPPCSPRVAPLWSMGRNSHPLPCTWLHPPLPMKETAFKRKIKDIQSFTYIEESLSDKNINLLGNQAPTQAAIRDLSC